jgi:hypothetical protein
MTGCGFVLRSRTRWCSIILTGALVGTAATASPPPADTSPASPVAPVAPSFTAPVAPSASGASASQWSSIGCPVRVAPGIQWHPAIAPDSAGGSFVAWIDVSYGSKVAVQHLLEDGTLAGSWPDTGLVISAPAQYMDPPVVVADNSGGAYVVWSTGTSHVYSVMVQHVDASGHIVAGWPALGRRVTTGSSLQTRPCAAADGAGGVYVVWEDDRNGADNPDIYIQRLQADATPPAGWDSAGTPLCASPGYQYRASVYPDGTGGLLAAWVDGYQVSAMRMTASGVPAPGWPENGVSVRVDTTYVWGAIVRSDLQGGCYVGWVGNWCAYVQHLDATGQPVGGWPSAGRLAAEPLISQDYETISADVLGVYVAWWDDEWLRVTWISSDGETPASWPAYGKTLMTHGGSLSPIAAVLLPAPDEDVYVIWCQDLFLSPAGSDLVATRLTSDGSVAEGWPEEPLGMCSANGGEEQPAAFSNDIGCTIAWCDGRNLTSDIYAGRLKVDGTVPTLLALVEAVADPDRVYLRWYGDGARISDATLYRRTETSAWSRLARLAADGTGTFEYADTAVEPGGRYGYRLAGATSAEDRWTEDAWVDVPEPGALALAMVRPNPVTGPLTVEFTLASREPARLELFDVNGRRLQSREVGGPGRHELQLADAGRLSGGVYWVRLAQGARALTRRCVVIR